MNPGYVRLAVPMDEALERFAEWMGRAEVEPARKVRALDAVDEACCDGEWRGKTVVVYEQPGWTVFEDKSGVLGDLPVEAWLRLAQSDELVFASYNDAIPYGELVVIAGGSVARELRDDPAEPAWHRNTGVLPGQEDDKAFDDWTGVAFFVDSDEIAESPREVLLWIFQDAE